jgi:hypothetical protein
LTLAPQQTQAHEFAVSCGSDTGKPGVEAKISKVFRIPSAAEQTAKEGELRREVMVHIGE